MQILNRRTRQLIMVGRPSLAALKWAGTEARPTRGIFIYREASRIRDSSVDAVSSE